VAKFLPMRYLFVFFCLTSINVFAQTPVSEQLSRLKTAPDNEKLKLYAEISRSYTPSQPDSAVYYANKGLSLAEKQSNWSGQAVLLLQLGRINMYHHHDALARRFYNEALGVSRRLHDAAGIANAYNELGLLDSEEQNVQSTGGNLSQAMKFYRDSRDSTDLLESYQRLGKVYEDKGNTEKALTYYLRALTQYEHRKVKPEAYFALLESIGNIYLKRGQVKNALNYLQEGIKNSSQPGLRDTEVSLLDEEGAVYQYEGQQKKALTIYKQAFEEAKKYKQPEEEAKALINIASVLKRQNSSSSLNDLKIAMGIAQKIHEPKLEARIYEAMAGIYKQDKNYQEAMKAIDEQHRLLDSLLKTDTAKDIAALDSSYALESSYEKIGHLQKTNQHDKTELQLGWIILVAILLIAAVLWFYLQKVKRLNLALKNSNKIKDTLFSVIGHDLKGPAGSAVQLFELMETEDFTEAELKGMIAELRKQTTASLELLKALFEWGRAQLQGIKVNPADFNPAGVVERCISLLSQQAGQKNIQISSSMPSNFKIHADADHFEFIVRNLLSNAIKFSYDGGDIKVAAQIHSSKEVVFSVTDNGVGIDKNQQQLFLKGNLVVKFGTAKEKGSGLGLLLTKDFIKANNGRIWLESREGAGTTFFIMLPAA